MSAAALMLFAWGLEIVLGWPDWLYRCIRHPVVWLGALIAMLERALNRMEWSHQVRYIAGVISTLLCVIIATGAGFWGATLLPATLWGVAVEALIASSLIASHSLHAHVAGVARPLVMGDVEGARAAVSLIVGRDPNQLDEAGVARASLESLAENASDGVIAPLFWGCLLGLPGLAGYKAINTLDSMIGHKNKRYTAFGGFAARLDDAANLIPARLTGLLIAAASFNPSVFTVMMRDARHHRSPNAGWPEASMAGGLGVRLSGPRRYGSHVSHEPWLNGAASDPQAVDIVTGLTLYRRAMVLAAILLVIIALELKA